MYIGKYTSPMDDMDEINRVSILHVLNHSDAGRHWPMAVACGRSHSAVLAKPLGRSEISGDPWVKGGSMVVMSMIE